MSEDNLDLFGGPSPKPERNVPEHVSQNVIPFGKYKGQPIEALGADPAYVEWLAGQAWFRDKYANIYTLIINNFAEPSETPAHNALQVLFLDDEFTRIVIECAESKGIWRDRGIIGMSVAHVGFEQWAIDVFVSMNAVIRWTDDRGYNDVAHKYEYNVTRVGRSSVEYAVELKPVVGDDYPAVLRQIRNLGSALSLRGRILFLEQYTGTGATSDQFVETFRRSGIAVVFRSEVGV